MSLELSAAGDSRLSGWARFFYLRFRWPVAAAVDYSSADRRQEAVAVLAAWSSISKPAPWAP